MRNRLLALLAAVGLLLGLGLAGATTAAATHGGQVYNSAYSQVFVIARNADTGQDFRLYPGQIHDSVAMFYIPSGAHALLWYNGRYIGCLKGGSTYNPGGAYWHDLRTYTNSPTCP